MNQRRERAAQRHLILIRFAQIGTVIELFKKGLLPEKDWLELQAWDAAREKSSIVGTSHWPRWSEFGVVDAPESPQFPTPFQKKTIKQSVRMAIFERDGFKCVDCGAQKDLTVDHIIPEILNGPHDPTNFCTRCRTCNSKKGKKIVRPSTDSQGSSSSQSIDKGNT